MHIIFPLQYIGAAHLPPVSAHFILPLFQCTFSFPSFSASLLKSPSVHLINAPHLGHWFTGPHAFPFISAPCSSCGTASYPWLSAPHLSPGSVHLILPPGSVPRILLLLHLFLPPGSVHRILLLAQCTSSYPLAQCTASYPWLSVPHITPWLRAPHLTPGSVHLI